MYPKVSQAFAALGLPQFVDRAAVKAEYRRLVLLRHPDKVPAGQKAQTQEDIKVLNAAYETLGGYLDWREEEEKKRRVEEEKVRRMREERRRLAESRREYIRLLQKKQEDERVERERVEEGAEEVRRMKAAWQQQ